MTQEAGMGVDARNTPDARAGSSRGAWVGLAALSLYVALLAVGTAGEVFHVRCILDLPIY